MKKLLLTLLPITALIIAAPVWAIDKSEVKKKHHTPYDLYLNAQEAHDKKVAEGDKVLLIDVRTGAEIRYIGMAEHVDANIPFMLDSDDWYVKDDGIHAIYSRPKNTDFVAAVENALKSKGLTKADPIIVICTGGSRAPKVARDLHKAGFGAVYTTVDGFEGVKAKEGDKKGQRVVNGWKNRGLPWSYKLKASKMYMNFDPKKVKETKPAETAMAAPAAKAMEEAKPAETVPAAKEEAKPAAKKDAAKKKDEECA